MYVLPISYPEQLAPLFDFTDGCGPVSTIRIIIKWAKELGSTLMYILTRAILSSEKLWNPNIFWVSGVAYFTRIFEQWGILFIPYRLAFRLVQANLKLRIFTKEKKKAKRLMLLIFFFKRNTSTLHQKLKQLWENTWTIDQRKVTMENGGWLTQMLSCFWLKNSFHNVPR